MSQIVKYACEQLGGAEINCIFVKGDPWFSGSQVAIVLGYKRPGDALYTHVPLKYKSKLSYLLKASKIGVSPTLDVSELNSSWISEEGLYKLTFKSKTKAAEVFNDWVCGVLKSIRKTGSYNDKYFYNKSLATKNDVRELATARGREDALHYQVVDHIQSRYPDATMHAGLGEHLTTKHAGFDAQLKGYTSGEPDLTITRQLPNGFQDVFAIEFKNPNGEGELTDNQIAYHRTLRENCNIETIVGDDYDKIIIAMHDHYQEVFARAALPTILDEPKTTISDEPKTYNFASNENPQHWCTKLKNLTGLVVECKKRGISNNVINIRSKREIASILITFDKEQREGKIVHEI